MPRILPFKGISPRIHADAFIADDATIIGDVEIGADASVWYGCVIRGDVNSIRIGSRTNIQDGTIIHASSQRPGQQGQRTEIGENVTVGHMALLHGCQLESGAFVGMRTIVLDGAVVETGAVLAANAMLTGGKRIPGGQLWAGSPAKLLRKLDVEKDRALPESANYYVKLSKLQES